MSAPRSMRGVRRATRSPGRSLLGAAASLLLGVGSAPVAYARDGVPPPSPAAPSPAVPPVLPAPATAARVHLEYRREGDASSCVAPEQLIADVEARLGRPVFAAAPAAELEARVIARAAAGRFVIEIALSDREGHRLGTRVLSTRAAHCSSLDDSVSLVLSLAADMPLAVATPGTPGPPRPSGPVEDVSVAPASLATPLTIPATTHAPRLGLQLRPTAGVGVMSGLLPALGAGVELGLTLRANVFWPVSLRGTLWSEQRRTLAARAGGATFSAQTLEVGVCPWTERFERLEASVCVLQMLGRGQARGFGFDEAWRRDAWLIHFGGGATLTQWLGPVFVSASAGLLVPAVRRRYFFTEGLAEGADITLHEQPWLSLSGAVRIGTEI